MRIEPVFLGDVPYEIHWGIASVEGKRVLDLGADIGSTADFFLSRKARDVVAVEGDKTLFEKLLENSKKIPEIIPVLKYIENEQDIASLLIDYRPEVVKVDVEGAEIYLHSVSNGTLFIPEKYLVECHTDDIYKKLEQKFKECRYKSYTYLQSPKTFFASKD